MFFLELAPFEELSKKKSASEAILSDFVIAATPYLKVPKSMGTDF
jgi:hypothetical protein